jgi:glycosyltransferase involved in cell wall biosynthesis
VVIPVYNEFDNIRPLYEGLVKAFLASPFTYEIIFVNDGSEDDTQDVLRQLADIDSHVKVIKFRRNYGQTAAISAGFTLASGEVIVTMDADLQNDPSDIPCLLDKIEQGYDVVSGWRQARRDTLLTRRIPSIVANRMISWVGGLSLHDYGCTLKAYRAEYAKKVRLYGEMHRFIPLYAKWMGATIVEIPVKHHPRIHGVSKYGLIRIFKVMLDLVTIKFLGDYATKPIYFFGGAGIVFIGVGVIGAVVTLAQKIWMGAWAHKNPLLLVSVFFELIGFQCILMGLLAEIIVRIYHETQSKPLYWIDEILHRDKS